MKKTTAEREHVLSKDCWCNLVVDSYPVETFDLGPQALHDLGCDGCIEKDGIIADLIRQIQFQKGCMDHRQRVIDGLRKELAVIHQKQAVGKWREQ